MLPVGQMKMSSRAKQRPFRRSPLGYKCLFAVKPPSCGRWIMVGSTEGTRWREGDKRVNEQGATQPVCDNLTCFLWCYSQAVITLGLRVLCSDCVRLASWQVVTNTKKRKRNQKYQHAKFLTWKPITSKICNLLKTYSAVVARVEEKERLAKTLKCWRIL